MEATDRPTTDSACPLEAKPAPAPKSTLREVGLLFLRLGFSAFGGPAAHVSIMEDEFVRRRGWLTREEFLDLLGAVNLIPGPNSTEMAIHVGYLRAGWRGLIVAGCAFILPAMLMVMAIAWIYVRFEHLPQLTGMLYGMKPVVIAVIAQALWRLGRTAAKTPLLAVVGLLVLTAGAMNVDALALLLGGGVLVGLVRGFAEREAGKKNVKPLLVMLLVAGGILTAAHLATRLSSAGGGEYSLQAMFFYFLKIGSVMYGTGYVLLAFLQTDLVQQWQWITSPQLLDATAVGQVTPGPLFTTATFIGYLKGGVIGAVVATAGIFLPAFVLVAASGKFVPRLRRSRVAGAFLDGVNMAALALMALVTWQLGRAAIVDVTTSLLAIASMTLLVRFRVNAAWLVLSGAAIGVAMLAAGFVKA